MVNLYQALYTHSVRSWKWSVLAAVLLFEAASLKEIDSDNFVQKFIVEYSLENSSEGAQVSTQTAPIYKLLPGGRGDYSHWGVFLWCRQETWDHYDASDQHSRKQGRDCAFPKVDPGLLSLLGRHLRNVFRSSEVNSLSAPSWRESFMASWRKWCSWEYSAGSALVLTPL